jgi:hypothetical protein
MGGHRPYGYGGSGLNNLWPTTPQDFPVNEEWETLRTVERIARQQEALEHQIDAHRLDMEEAERMRLWRERRQRISQALFVLSSSLTWATIGVAVGALMWLAMS